MQQPRLGFFLLLILALGGELCFFAKELHALDVVYEINSYGKNHSVVVLSGAVRNNLSTNLSSDGQTLRISGVSVVFLSRNKSDPSDGLIKYVQQVKRGAFTDLVLGLSQASELSATPSANTLKLYVKAKSDVSYNTSGSNRSSAGATRAPPPLHVYFRNQAVLGNSLIAPGISFVLPELDLTPEAPKLAAHLHFLGYAVQFAWRWFAGPLKSEKSGSSSSAASPESLREIQDLEKLVEDLTKELVDVRNEVIAARAKCTTAEAQSTP